MNAFLKMTKSLLICAVLAWIVFAVWSILPDPKRLITQFGPGQTAVSQGPPVLALAKMSELVTLKVNMNTSLEARNNWYEGAWLLVGDALIATDCKQRQIGAVDHARKKFTMALPEPRVISCRVNHEGTRTLFLRSISWNPAQLFSGNKEEIREEAMKQAQWKLERCASSEEYFRQAKTQAEAALGQLYAELGWKLTLEWRKSIEAGSSQALLERAPPGPG